MKHAVWMLTVLLLTMLLAGCVTQSSGGLPEPAPKAERAKAQIAVGRGYIGIGSWTNAKRALEKALSFDPGSVEAHVLFAVAYEAEEEYELAETYYRKALRLDAKDPQALNNYGSFLFRRDRLDEATTQLKKVVKDTEYRARPQAFENLGLVELKKGDLSTASAAFERALSLNKNQPVSALELGYMAFDRGELGLAFQRYEEFKKNAKPSARSLCLGMKLGAAANNPDQVASAAMALKNLFPKSREAESCRAPSQ